MNMPAPQVQEMVEFVAPHLAVHLRPDGSWLWYCGPSLKEDPAARETLKNLGFRFAKAGHVMPDKQTRSFWGHSCDRPTRRRRRHRFTSAEKEADDTSTELSHEEILAAL